MGSMPAQTKTKLHGVALASTCLAIGKQAAVVAIQGAGHEVPALDARPCKCPEITTRSPVEFLTSDSEHAAL